MKKFLNILLMPATLISGVLFMTLDKEVLGISPPEKPADFNEAEVMCYDMTSIEMPEPEMIDYKNQLESLEKLYKNNKIDSKTYEIKSKELKQKIEELEK